MSNKMAAAMIFSLLVLAMSRGRLLNDYVNRERYDSIGQEIKDYLSETDRSREVKRQTPSGSCTCTCETKPVLGGRKNFPETAAMMRTAVKPDMASSGAKVKDPVATRLYQSDSVHGDQRSKIRKIDPWEYSHMLNADNYNDGNHDVNEPVEEKEESEKEDGKTTDVDEAESTENWGHESRFPWKNLPDKMCYRHSCSNDRHCCRRFNHCDKSAKVCTDCWHGSNCNSELDCCQRYPYCQTSKSAVSGSMGRCVDVLKEE